jgi:hypothetical protein
VNNRVGNGAQMVQDAAKDVMEGLTNRERYHLRSMRGYRPVRRATEVKEHAKKSVPCSSAESNKKERD